MRLIKPLKAVGALLAYSLQNTLGIHTNSDGTIQSRFEAMQAQVTKKQYGTAKRAVSARQPFPVREKDVNKL
jgi:hypothetical protein